VLPVPFHQNEMGKIKMVNLSYLVPRVIRHFLPDGLVRFLLQRNLIIRPGLETRDPVMAARRYLDVLGEYGLSIAGKSVLLFGYGGRFGVGCELLRQGASHVILAEREGFPEDRHNQALLPAYSEYLELKNSHVAPRPEVFTCLHADIRQAAAEKRIPPADLVFSTSVYEHLGDVEEITAALASLTRPDGANLHFIDLRDHYFKYSFEMLCYSNETWRRWLNPTSNHNRYRFRDYERVFQGHFSSVDIKVLERDRAAFEHTLPRIKAEFLTGDPQIDSITLIRVAASRPKFSSVP
jgi:hypothetical protein